MIVAITRAVPVETWTARTMAKIAECNAFTPRRAEWPPYQEIASKATVIRPTAIRAAELLPQCDAIAKSGRIRAATAFRALALPRTIRAGTSVTGTRRPAVRHALMDKTG
jgi:hypothetical protein